MIKAKHIRFTAIKTALTIIVASVMLFAGMALSQASQKAEAATPSKYIAQINIKDYGTVVVELDRDAAPITVDNFVSLSKSGFYNNRNIPFHRVESGFVIQGGDPNGDGTGGSDQTIKGEFSENGWNNPISHKRGVISMARSGDTKTGFDTASSQFFIVLADGSYSYEVTDDGLKYVYHANSETLDGQYAAFGYVISGMTIIDEIVSNTEYEDSTVTNPAIIDSITITPYLASSGWQKSGNSWWYAYDSDARAYYQNQPYYASDIMIPVNGKWYYFNTSGWMATGWKYVNNHWYYFGPNGDAQSGWVYDNGAWYLMNDDGVMLTGWQTVDGYSYFLESSGAMKTGWHLSDGNWYYLATYTETDDDGSVLTPMGAAKTNTITYFGDSAYMFDYYGVMATGLQSAYVGPDDNGEELWYTFFFGSSGAHQTGWIKASDKWYYFNPNNGIAVKGWNYIGAWYLMDNKGAMLTGWQETGGKTYYLGGADDGSMKTGWIKDDGYWYYLDSTGAMVVNAWIGNYYVGSDGKMLTKTWVVWNNKEWYVDENGHWNGLTRDVQASSTQSEIAKQSSEPELAAQAAELSDEQAIEESELVITE